MVKKLMRLPDNNIAEVRPTVLDYGLSGHTLNRACDRAGKQQDISFALVISFDMIVRQIFSQV